MRSISSFEYRSKRSRYSAGTSTSSYSPAFVPFLYRWHFFEKRLMMPWNSGPSPTGISTGITFGVDRKSTRLNFSHTVISYAVFCLKKKKFEKQNLLMHDPRDD